MDRLKTICSILLVICIAVVTITLGQTVIYRSPDAYLFYFNDSQCVDKIYTSLSNTEMADELAAFMNSFRPEEFQIYEDTGYDQLPIFDSRDSYNMMVLKKMVDISGIFCLIGLVLMVSIYVWFKREDEKKLLRNCFRIGAGISAVLIVVQAVIMSIDGLRDSYFRLWGVRTPAADSNLEIIMGDDFWGMLTIFLTGASLIILGVLVYINYRATRPPRIFY